MYSPTTYQTRLTSFSNLKGGSGSRELNSEHTFCSTPRSIKRFKASHSLIKLIVLPPSIVDYPLQPRRRWSDFIRRAPYYAALIRQLDPEAIVQVVERGSIYLSVTSEIVVDARPFLFLP